MKQEQLSQLEDEVTEVIRATDEYLSRLRVTATFVPARKGNGGEIRVTVSTQYEYIIVNLPLMLELAKIFKTMEYKVNNWSQGGCETCDYGSKYVHEFSFPEPAE